jgi:hypothetical protein
MIILLSVMIILAVFNVEILLFFLLWNFVHSCFHSGLRELNSK